MYPIPPTETLVETKACKHCGVSFPITDKDLEFYEKVSPVFNGERYAIPTPTLCPDCRQQRRLSFRNERKLYKRKCDATGRDIISIYSPDKPFKVYHQDFWWSDKWDPMEYGRDFDFGRSFFEQYGDLLKSVPRLCMSNKESENSDYCNISLNNKGCYLSFATKDSEEIYYSFWITKCENCMDCAITEDSTEGYELLECNNCYDLRHSINCIHCSRSSFLIDCDNCSDCLLSIGLRNKSHYILNKKVSEDEFDIINTRIQNDRGFHTEMQEKFNNLLKISPRKNLKNIDSSDCIGDFYKHSSNCTNCFDIFNGEGLKHSLSCKGAAKDCYDCSFFANTENSLESSGIIGYKIAFSETCWHNKDIYYNNDCYNSSNLFGCIGLRNKSYCILNKQYAKEEYEELVPKIIEHMMTSPLIRGDGGGFEWGEFFPSRLSPFGYNETVAQEYYPLDRRDEKFFVSTSGKPIFNWSDYEAPFPKVEKIIPAGKLPEDISKIPDDILNWAIECEVTGKPFRIIKQELEFYRKHNLPIPKRHPDQRHLDRMSLRNPKKMDVK
ncbi:MAG: hypothetical protein Q8K26_01330 [Candidatus Gracilibacteria bacterium]|nr:hypothetical protein [Candidatus Gracilibacteria bacterium]